MSDIPSTTTTHAPCSPPPTRWVIRFNTFDGEMRLRLTTGRRLAMKGVRVLSSKVCHWATLKKFLTRKNKLIVCYVNILMLNSNHSYDKIKTWEKILTHHLKLLKNFWNHLDQNNSIVLSLMEVCFAIVTSRDRI